jgi:hypothetical protein
MYILGEYYSDLALNKICFWHFITMSQSTKRRWNSGPSTPSSTSKKKKYNYKFQDEWKKSHHWIQSSSLGNDLAFYTLCSSNFSVASGGLYDIKRYSETSFHKKAVTATNKTPQLHQFIPTKSVDDQMTRAETLFSNFVAEHNLLSFNYKVQFCAFKGDAQNLPLRRVGRGRSPPSSSQRLTGMQKKKNLK